MQLSLQSLEIAFLIFLVLWTVAFGAAIGSFLNVIIYRMPRGLSLVRPKSQCPSCGRAIRARDNLPLLGWLLLRGRCRDCGAPISIRYPLVEGILAILLLGLSWCELFRGGVNLPGVRPTPLEDPLLWRFDVPMVALVAFHFVLVASVVALGWIAWDGFRPPSKLMLVAGLVGFVLPLIVPGLRPGEEIVPAWIPASTLGAEWEFDPQSLIEGVAGLVAGLVGGALVSIAAASRDDRAAVVVLGSLAGLYLGSLAMVTAAPLAAAGVLLLSLLGRLGGKTIPAAVGCAAAMIVQIFAWRWLVEFGNFATAAMAAPLGRNLVLVLSGALLTVLLALAGRAVGSTFLPSSGRNVDSESTPTSS